MNSKPYIFAAIMLIVLSSTTSAQTGKTPPQENPREEKTLKQETTESTQALVYHLRYTSASLAQSVIAQSSPRANVRLAVDEVTNSIIVYASQTEHAAIATTLKLLDQPRKEIKPTIRRYQPNVRKANEAVRFLVEFLDNRDFKISIDSSNNGFVVASADPKVFESIDELLQLIDKEEAEEETPKSAPCRVRISWLTDKATVPQEFFTRKVPGSLGEVADYFKEDEGIELGNLTNMQTVVQCMANGDRSDFNSRSSRTLGVKELQMLVTGKVALTSESKVQMALSINLQSGSSKRPTAPIETTLELPMDHPVVFSVTDVDGLYSILVLEVTKAY